MAPVRESGPIGTIVYNYDEVGKPMVDRTGVGNSVLFNGQQYDPETVIRRFAPHR